MLGYLKGIIAYSIVGIEIFVLAIYFKIFKNESIKKKKKKIIMCSNINNNTFGNKIKIIGIENLPKESNYILTPNHLSIIDIVTLYSGLQHLDLAFIAKKELDFIFMGTVLKETNSLFMDRDSLKKAALTIKKGSELVKNGTKIIVFPEGTRSKEDKVGEFKAGSLKFAEKAKADIVPITLVGTNKLIENKLKIVGGTSTIIIHKAIKYDDYKDRDIVEVSKDIQKIISDSYEKNK